MKCPKERSAPKEKRSIVATKLPKLKREKRNCGNQIAENRRKKKKLWQPSCRNCRGELKKY